ncbi:MAG: hypothetical protein ABJE95_34140 [Byssovorax sp.]
MTHLLLTDIDVETAEKLALRAKRLGTTPEEEAARLLRDRLRAEPSGELSAADADEVSTDPRFERRHGFLVFTGTIATEAVPDHRALRDERVDSFLKGADEGSF